MRTNDRPAKRKALAPLVAYVDWTGHPKWHTGTVDTLPKDAKRVVKVYPGG